MIKGLIFTVGGIALLIILFFLFKPNATSQKLVESPDVNSNQKVFEITISDNKIISGQSVLKVNQDDSIVLKIISDTPEEFHLHGYDRSVDLEKGVSKELSFVADITGRFVFELEHSRVELGAVEVFPQ